MPMNCFVSVRSPCHTSPCENGGICEASGSTFVCRCGAGFHGERCHCMPVSIYHSIFMFFFILCSM